MPGGSGGGQSSQTVTQTNLPEYARPYFERLMSRAEATANEPYQRYGGPRIAGFTPDMLNAQQGFRGLAQYGTPGMDEGYGYANRATEGAMGAGAGYDQSYQDIDPRMMGTGAGYQNLVSGYMNPYIENVLRAQKDAADLDYQRQRADRAAGYVKSGAFGGSRQAVADALAEESLLNRQSGIDVQGYNTAWNLAHQSAIDAQRFNIGNQMQSDYWNQIADLNSRQFGSNLGLQGYQTAMQGAGLMSDIDAARYQQRQSQMRDLAAIGQDWQNLAQAGLDVRYEDFINQRDYPRTNLNFLSGILRGVPVTPSQSQSNYQFRSPISQLFGSGLSGYALSQLMGQQGATA